MVIVFLVAHLCVLEWNTGLEVLGDFPLKMLERYVANEKEFGALLIPRELARANVPGMSLWGYLTPPVAGAYSQDFLVSSCLQCICAPFALFDSKE